MCEDHKNHDDHDEESEPEDQVARLDSQNEERMGLCFALSE